MADEPRKRKLGLARRKPAAELVRAVESLPAGTGKKAGLMAGVAGLGAVGTATARSAAKAIRNRKAVEDAYRGEDFALLEADRGCVVTTPDGVPLIVREVGPITAPLTVVFAHGFCQRMGAFHFQRAALAERWGDQVRMVFYDQRGHGQSGSAPIKTYSVEQLGQDLETILKVMVPRGPVVVVGHSMGGMTVLSHARQFPENYGRRIVGAAIISSAAGGLSRSPLGEILNNPALEAVRFAARYVPKMVHRTRGATRSALRPIIKTASFGDDHISRSLAAFNEDMIHGTEVATLVAGVIAHVNQLQPEGLRIRRFVNLHKDFDADDGEITRTRKLRRNTIETTYASLIAALYGSERETVYAAAITMRAVSAASSAAP